MFNKNLKYLREKFNMEQIDLAHKLGRKSSSSISEWEKGKYTPKIKTLAEIANIFKVDLDDLMNKDLTKIDKEEPVSRPLVPIVGSVAAGEPNYAVEDIEGYMTLPPNQKSADGLIYLRVKSDSMDKQFPVGSYVLIDTYSDVENGNVAVVKVNGDEATLKQVKFDYGEEKMHLIPNSHNDAHFPQMVDIDDGVSLVGKVVGMYMDI